ncbi:DUF1707 SHOCT-like domain-containing protein [Corynebacterium halotolerans]|uniref:Uncharacterized protein n=1 Tax=Corynebacterium halotolerans YIM 70093 = DSM 44683 TaxID=1121362 RepID=M1MUV3_9CORY|nr:DUF1707 domain-containing protein [Corynebacterium halotolerans]AGF71494.1 hypothetical protein A605_02400 [Corynebacterium halotolerans YIM 70093 = DSM 44683]
MSDGGTPRLRASDDDRRRVAAALSDAFARGQLDYGELDARTEQVWSARYRDELFAPLSDLLPDPARILEDRAPAPRPRTAPRSPRAGAETARQQVTGEPGGQSLTFSLLGMSQKRGDWLCSPTHHTTAMLGSTVIDLRLARLTCAETTINAFGVLGAVEILVPEDVLVIGDGYGVLGAFEVTEDKKVTVAQRDLPADAPVVRVRGLGLLGSVGIRRVPRESGD